MDLNRIIDDVCDNYDILEQVDLNFRNELLDYLNNYIDNSKNISENVLKVYLMRYIEDVLYDNGDEKGISDLDNSYYDDILYNYSNEKLATLYFSSDKDMRNRILEIIIFKNQAYIYKTVNNSYNYNYDNYDDLLQVSRIAVLEALNSYNPSKARGTFINYCTYYLKNNIWKEKKNYRSLCISNDIYSLIIKYSNIKHKFFSKNGRDATDEEISSIMNLSMEKIEKLKLLEKNYKYVTAEDLNFDTSKYHLWDVVADKNVNIVDSVENEDYFNYLDSILDRVLNVNEKIILKCRLGFINGEEITLENTASYLASVTCNPKLSHQRISQIYNNAIAKLKKSPLFGEWIKLFSENRIDLSDLIDEKSKKKANLKKRRKSIRDSFQLVKLTDYYMCSMDELMEALNLLTTKEINLFNSIFGFDYSKMIDSSLFNDERIKTIDKRIAFFVNDIKKIKGSKVLSK